MHGPDLQTCVLRMIAVGGKVQPKSQFAGQRRMGGMLERADVPQIQAGKKDIRLLLFLLYRSRKVFFPGQFIKIMNPRMAANSFIHPRLYIYLYNGIPIESLNHSTNFGESPGSGDVMSHGSSTSLPSAAQTNRTGTIIGREKKKTIPKCHSW